MSLKLLANFYKGKTVLVTGHTGFKGAWLSFWLAELGAKVIGYALPPNAEQHHLFDALALQQNINSIIGDINNYDQFLNVITTHKPQLVFHLAAQSLVRSSYRDPLGTFATNLMGTVNVLEALRKNPEVKALINITTDKCYDNKEWIWGYREVDRLGGKDPYSASKACAELATYAYRQSFFTGSDNAVIASARAGNVIGGGDWSIDRLIPDIVRAIADEKPIVIRNPNSLRPWQHVLDVLHGYLLLGQNLIEKGSTFAEAWNFGPNAGDTFSVKELATEVVKHWGSGEINIQPDPHAPHEASLLKLDSSKARQALNWKPLLTATQAIEMTVNWYRTYLEHKNSVIDFTKQQISDYMQN